VAIPTYEYGYKVDDNEYWELDINFEDSEEERDLGLDDGFEEKIVAFASEETFGARKPDVHTNNVDDSHGVDVGNAHEDSNYDENDYVLEDLDNAFDFFSFQNYSQLSIQITHITTK